MAHRTLASNIQEKSIWTFTSIPNVGLHRVVYEMHKSILLSPPPPLTTTTIIIIIII